VLKCLVCLDNIQKLINKSLKDEVTKIFGQY